MEAASRIDRCANSDCAADGLSGALLFHRYRIGSCRVAGRVASTMALRAHLDNYSDYFTGNDQCEMPPPYSRRTTKSEPEADSKYEEGPQPESEPENRDAWRPITDVPDSRQTRDQPD